MGRIVIVREKALCHTYGDEYAIVEMDTARRRGTHFGTHFSIVLGMSVRVIETTRDLAEAQERFPLWGIPERMEE
jgi:hypothetical protein